jgi:hypothetical protein
VPFQEVEQAFHGVFSVDVSHNSQRLMCETI